MNIYYLKKLRKEAKKSYRVRYANGKYLVERDTCIPRGSRFYNFWETVYEFRWECEAVYSLIQVRRSYVLRRIEKIRNERYEERLNNKLAKL